MYSTLFYTVESDMPQDITKVTKRQLTILNYIYTNGHPSQVRSMEISQDAFAKVLRITRQALSNHLKRLRDLKLIRTGRKFIDITEEGLKIMGESRERQDAFVFVKVKPQARNKVYDAIKKNHTTTVYRVTGDVDLIALVQREKLDDFLKKVSGINGVIKTSAHIILDQLNP